MATPPLFYAHRARDDDGSDDDDDRAAKAPRRALHALRQGDERAAVADRIRRAAGGDGTALPDTADGFRGLGLSPTGQVALVEEALHAFGDHVWPWAYRAAPPEVVLAVQRRTGEAPNTRDATTAELLATLVANNPAPREAAHALMEPLVWACGPELVCAGCATADDARRALASILLVGDDDAPGGRPPMNIGRLLRRLPVLTLVRLALLNGGGARTFGLLAARELLDGTTTAATGTGWASTFYDRLYPACPCDDGRPRSIPGGVPVLGVLVGLFVCGRAGLVGLGPADGTGSDLVDLAHWVRRLDTWHVPTEPCTYLDVRGDDVGPLGLTDAARQDRPDAFPVVPVGRDDGLAEARLVVRVVGATMREVPEPPSAPFGGGGAVPSVLAGSDADRNRAIARRLLARAVVEKLGAAATGPVGLAIFTHCALPLLLGPGGEAVLAACADDHAAGIREAWATTIRQGFEAHTALLPGAPLQDAVLLLLRFPPMALRVAAAWAAAQRSSRASGAVAFLLREVHRATAPPSTQDQHDRFLTDLSERARAVTARREDVELLAHAAAWLVWQQGGARALFVVERVFGRPGRIAALSGGATVLHPDVADAVGEAGGAVCLLSGCEGLCAAAETLAVRPDPVLAARGGLVFVGDKDSRIALVLRDRADGGGGAFEHATDRSGLLCALAQRLREALEQEARDRGETPGTEAARRLHARLARLCGTGASEPPADTLPAAAAVVLPVLELLGLRAGVVQRGAGGRTEVFHVGQPFFCPSRTERTERTDGGGGGGGRAGR